MHHIISISATFPCCFNIKSDLITGEKSNQLEIHLFGLVFFKKLTEFQTKRHVFFYLMIQMTFNFKIKPNPTNSLQIMHHMICSRK